MGVPNQKRIIIKRDSERAQSDFFKVSNQNLNEAVYNLDTKSFLLWLYFADNQNGYIKDLYPVDFVSWSGLSKSSYDRAFKELEEKGYLIKHKEKDKYYLFMEKSNKAERPDEVKSVSQKELEDLLSDFLPDSEVNQNE